MTTREQRLADVFVELAADTRDNSLVASGVPGILSTLADRSGELLGADAASVTAAPGKDGPPHVAGSGPEVSALELAASDWGEGPGHECRAGGAALPATDLTGRAAGERWPRYAPWARELDFACAAALPLRDGDVTFGALVLLYAPGRAVSECALVLGQSLADFTANSLLLVRELEQSRARSEQLQRALDSRTVIEQAKGVLAARRAISPDEAFVLLRGHARSRRRVLAEVARDVIDGKIRADGEEVGT